MVGGLKKLKEILDVQSLRETAQVLKTPQDSRGCFEHAGKELVKQKLK